MEAPEVTQACSVLPSTLLAPQGMHVDSSESCLFHLGVTLSLIFFFISVFLASILVRGRQVEGLVSCWSTRWRWGISR